MGNRSNVVCWRRHFTIIFLCHLIRPILSAMIVGWPSATVPFVDSFRLLPAATDLRHQLRHCATDETIRHHDTSSIINCYRPFSSLRLRSIRDGNLNPESNASLIDDGPAIVSSSSDLVESSTDANPTTCNDTAASMTIRGTSDENRSTVSAAEGTIENADSNGEGKWQAGDYDRDYRLLEIAMARQSAMADLHQRRRKYTLDYGFARNRRPLVRDLLSTTVKIGAWVAFLASGDPAVVAGGAASRGGIVTSALRARGRWPPLSLWSWRELHVLAARSTLPLSVLHHWIVGMALPLVLLALVRSGRLGPAGRALEEGGGRTYSSSSSFPEGDDAPSFFYTTAARKKRARGGDKDTGNFVLCLIENWSSAVALPFVVGATSALLALSSSLANRRTIAAAGGPAAALAGGDGIDACVRLLTRAGAAAALHQYPPLLFELRRDDQPRPLCRSTALMRRAAGAMLGWLPLGAASDVAVLLGRSRGGWGGAGASFFGSDVGRGTTLAASSLSMLSPLCHLIALGRIVRISKCSALSLSRASTFPADDELDEAKDKRCAAIDDLRRVRWRYQLRWRTPQRLGEMLRTWRNYFFTGHVPLLLEMDEWNARQIRFDDFSTEGAPRSMRRGPTVAGGGTFDDTIPDADAIAESLSLIFRDREAAVRNATRARSIKHRESYDAKTLDDVLGVAVERTFDVGLSYDFDHFDCPADGEEVSVHQLRARMAKSAVRRKRELDGAMANELGVLRRLKDNVVTSSNREVAEDEMKSAEQVVRDRHADEVDRMRDALRTMIPTGADAPKGTAERYDSPIMVAEYVDLKASLSTGRGELKVVRESAPDSLSAIEEYVRRDFGDEAAEAYRREEIAARKKEKEMFLKFRRRFGELKDRAESEAAFSGVDDIE
jgi:hypothetical protein